MKIQQLTQDIFKWRELEHLTITIQAHANENSSPEYRIGVSGRRAEAIKDILVAQGLPREKIVTQSTPVRTWTAPAGCMKRSSGKRPECRNPGSPASVVVDVIRIQ